MKEPRILYSTNTVLAYRINRKYYGDVHYVWCAPEFGSAPLGGGAPGNPPTSRPLHRYRQLQAESQAGDLHSSLIGEQKAGLRKGADEKLKGGVITPPECDEIIQVIDSAPLSDFKPVIYAMAFAAVKHLAKRVPVAQRAHPLSEEYIIETLAGDIFDILNLD